MRATARRLLQTFVTGLLAALPLAATIAVFVWGAQVLYAWLGPGSLIGDLLVSIGLGVGGTEVAGYAIGVLIVMAAIFLLGVLVQTRLRGALAALLDGVVQRIPVVRGVYDLVQKFVALFAQRKDAGLQSMSAVWLTFGAPGNAAVLGLLSSPEPVRLHERDYLAVLVPTAPVPVGGGLIYVPAEWVTPAEIGVEALTSIYVSMGITSAQHLRR
jgi:uncharacterized membrane protein